MDRPGSYEAAYAAAHPAPGVGDYAAVYEAARPAPGVGDYAAVYEGARARERAASMVADARARARSSASPRLEVFERLASSPDPPRDEAPAPVAFSASAAVFVPTPVDLVMLQLSGHIGPAGLPLFVLFIALEVPRPVARGLAPGGVWDFPRLACFAHKCVLEARGPPAAGDCLLGGDAPRCGACAVSGRAACATVLRIGAPPMGLVPREHVYRAAI
jgi:hypothetical protein